MLNLIYQIFLFSLLPLAGFVGCPALVGAGLHFLHSATTGIWLSSTTQRGPHLVWPARLSCGIVGLVFVALGIAIAVHVLTLLIRVADAGK